MAATLFSVIAPVVICALIGWVWGRRGKHYDTPTVTTLATDIGTPCLAFATLVDTGLDPEAFLRMAGATVLTLGAFVVVYMPMLKAMGLSRQAFLPSLIFANVGNMGLPLCLLAFGEEGLALAMSYFAVMAIALFTVGPAVASGTTSVKELVRLPVLYAIAAALVFIFTGIKPPEWIANTMRIIGGLTIPLMLITLGVSLASLKVASLPRSVLISVMRLGIGFAIGWGAAELLGFEGIERGVLILECTMPVAVFNYLFAVRYDQRPDEVAGIVVVSTLMSFATLPFLLAFVM